MTTLAERAMRQIQSLIARGCFDELEILAKGRCPRAADIKLVLEEHGVHAAVPPDSAYEGLDIVAIRDTAPPAWSVRMPLWETKSGPSDLTVEITVSQRGADTFDVEVDGIHVL